MDNYPINLLKTMLETYSPSGQEKELSIFLQAELKKLDFNSRVDDVGNVIGESGQGAPIVLLCGHMDTVPGDLEIRIDDDRIRGRGAVDAKSSLAAMIIGASRAKDDFPGKILVLGVVDEEGSGTGMRHFIRTNPIGIDYAVLGEPSNTENIVTGYKGLLHLKLECSAKTGHSAAPWRYDNAIDKAMEIWEIIKSDFPDSSEHESRFHSVTGCLTGIVGGEAINMVPSKCTLTIDMRIPPELGSDQTLDDIKKKVRSYLDSNPNVKIDLKLIDQVEACLADSDSKIARSYSWAIRRIRRKNPVFLKKTGTSDMNLLASKVGIPMIAYGPGDSRLDHTIDEEILVKDYLAAIEIHREALKRLADLHIRSG